MNQKQKILAYKAISENVEHTTARKIVRYVLECELWNQDTVSPSNEYLSKKYNWNIETTKVAISKAKKSQFITTTGYGKKRCLELNVSFLKGKMAEIFQKTIRHEVDFSDVVPIEDANTSANGLANTSANTLANGLANSFEDEKTLTKGKNEVFSEDNSNSNNNNLKSDDFEEEETPFSSTKYIELLRENKSPHVRLIGWYFKERRSVFPDKQTIQAELKRWVKDAAFISKYDNEKIFKAHQLVKKKYPDEWNLSTIRKYIPEA